MTGKSTRRSKCQPFIPTHSQVVDAVTTEFISRPENVNRLIKAVSQFVRRIQQQAYTLRYRAIVQTFVTLAEAMVGVRQLHRNSK